MHPGHVMHVVHAHTRARCLALLAHGMLAGAVCVEGSWARPRDPQKNQADEQSRKACHKQLLFLQRAKIRKASRGPARLVPDNRTRRQPCQRSYRDGEQLEAVSPHHVHPSRSDRRFLRMQPGECRQPAFRISRDSQRERRVGSVLPVVPANAPRRILQIVSWRRDLRGLSGDIDGNQRSSECLHQGNRIGQGPN